jgi:hypothetical protein
VSIALAERLGELQGALGERGLEVLKELAARSDDLRGLFDTRGEQLVEALSARGNQIASEMRSLSETVTQAIDGRSAAIVQQLGDKQNELTAAVERAAAHLREAIDTDAAAAVRALAETNDKVSAGVAEVIDRLVNSSAALQNTVTTTGTDFAAAERSLTQRMDEFRAMLTRVTAETGQFNESTRAILGEASGLAETVARHRESLASSAGALSREQGGLEEMLAARCQSLESLLGSVKDRRDELEGVMQAFLERVEELFNQADSRAQSISTVLAETSQASAGMIERQFSQILASAGEERERSAAAARNVCTQAKAELEGIFGQTTERFQSAAAELRHMAGDIQRELEETREVLRRGAADLPHETQQQVAAMRRVVAEQIKALEELSEIVTRSGRAFDVSQAHSTEAGRTLAQSAPARLGGPIRSVEPQRTSQPSRLAAQMPPGAERAAEARASERGGGWLSDLLAKVDSEEPGTASSPAAKIARQPQRLDVISPDIARMIDHAAAADAWERYRRGESGAFSRRIYAGRGPQVFDDIRRRYRLDPEFRDTVDRYLRDFERLLAEAGQDAGNETVAKAYLLSETGKVYTLLAHAAGKLG